MKIQAVKTQVIEIKLINTDEFISMWIDGDFKNSKVKNDFIAVK